MKLGGGVKKEKISIFISLIIFFPLFVLAIDLSELNETQCIESGANWAYIEPENEEPKYVCKCEEYDNRGFQTKFWNGTNCLDVTDEIRCERTNGIWENNQCSCEGGVWVDNIGCQFIEYDENNNTLIFLAIIPLLLILIGIFYYKRRRV